MLCESISGSTMHSPERGWRRDPFALRFATFEELLKIAPATDSEWLTAGERAEFRRLRHPARRGSWRCGRLLAKRLLRDTAAADVVDLHEIEILSHGRDGRSVRPEIRIGGDPLPWCLSIAHSTTAALAAVSFDPGTMVGVDLVQPEAVRPGFLETWFTERERNWLASQPAEVVALCWGLKEAVYKASQRGEAFAPRRIEVLQSSEGVVVYYDHSPMERARIAVERFDGQFAIVVTRDESGPP